MKTTGIQERILGRSGPRRKVSAVVQLQAVLEVNVHLRGPSQTVRGLLLGSLLPQYLPNTCGSMGDLWRAASATGLELSFTRLLGALDISKPVARV